MNKIEVIFSNPLSIELEVEQMSLLAELKEESVGESSRFLLKLLVITADTATTTIKIPANCPAHRAQLGFVYNTLDEFKLVGYELTSSLRLKNEIMFAEISSPKASNNSNNDAGSSSGSSSSRLSNLIANNNSTSGTSLGEKSLSSSSSVEPVELTPVLPTYEVKMVPKLPVISAIELVSSDLNQNRQCVSQLVNSKYLTVPCKLGLW